MILKLFIPAIFTACLFFTSCRVTSSSGTLDQIYKVTDYITGQEHNGRDGLVYAYYNNGKKYSQEYWKRGKLQGQRIVWYSDGSVKSLETFHKGKLHGEKKIYNEEGQLILHQRYDEDVMVEDFLTM